MKIKVCGLKYKDNIDEIAKLKVDYLGFIFYSKSKRFVGEDFEMPETPKHILKIGVFVNADIDYVIEKVNRYKLNGVQIHGDESAEYCKELKAILNADDVVILKAFGIDEAFDFNSLKDYEQHCDYFLFDTKTKDYGGSGKQFDWKILENYNNPTPYFISGGIGVEEFKDVKANANLLNYFAIDVNSKFEIEPGLKNIDKLKEIA
jgi:phosphoribosylanthranilate isomerase